jgi:hypothetical protein
LVFRPVPESFFDFAAGAGRIPGNHIVPVII